MPETLTVTSSIDLDTLGATQTPRTILKVMVEQMFEHAERTAAEAGRRMQS